MMFYREKFAKALKKFGVFFPGEDDLNEIMGDKKTEIGNIGLGGDEGASHDEKLVQVIKKQAYNRLVHTELLKQANINAVVSEAASVFPVDDQADESEVDIGWILKFMDMAGDISDKSLQKIWGKILAGKVKNTSGVSLHSLFTLANLSADEAELFINISRYVINIDGINLLLNNTQFNNEFGIKYYDIMMLDEYGLINSSGTLSMNKEISNLDMFSLKYGHNLTYGSSMKTTKFTLPIFTIREAGNDLLSVLNINYDYKYFEDVKNTIMEGNKEIKFTDVQVS